MSSLGETPTTPKAKIYCDLCDQSYQSRKEDEILKCLMCGQKFLLADQHPCSENTMVFLAAVNTTKEKAKGEQTCIFICPRPECNRNRKAYGWVG